MEDLEGQEAAPTTESEISPPTFERRIQFTAAYDKRTDNPATNCGVHGVNCYFYLIGPKGAVQFVIYTNWMLPHVQAETDAKPLGEFPYMFHKPMPADIGYHSPEPLWEGQTPIERDCEFTGGKPCYYDGSTLNAEPVFDVLTREGSEGVWRVLEERYAELFNEGKSSSNETTEPPAKEKYSAFTPGPWTLKGDWQVRNGEGVLVAKVYETFEFPTADSKWLEEYQANGRLIAAAPELHDACAALLSLRNYDSLAAEFLIESGMQAPGKSYPLECLPPDEEEQRKLWREFLQRKGREAETLAAAALTKAGKK